MILIIIFIGILIVSGYLFGARTLGIFITLLGFAMLTSSPVLAIGTMILGITLFVGIGSKR